jgi:pilus assembly protein CpaE
MARLIAVSINCRNEAIRRNFEEIVSQRRDYLIAKGKGTGAADMVLLDLDELRPQQTFAHIRELLSAAPDLEIFLTATRTDPQVLLEAFRIGVKEFLSQPLTRQEVEPALARFEERFSIRAPESGRQPGRVVCVVGARGGIGTSTVAVNVAAAIQQNIHRESAALVDLDQHGGELGLFLDLHPSQGFKQLSTDLSRLDETIVLSSLVKHESNLNFLASGHEGFAESDSIPGSAMRVIGLLRSLHRQIVIDCGHILEPSVREALDCSDRIVVVTALSLPALRRTRSLLQILRTAKYPTNKVVVVINRYEKDQKDLLREAEGMLGARIDGLIPNDYPTTREAIDHGKPVVTLAPKTLIGQWFAQEVGRLIGDPSISDNNKMNSTGKKMSLFGLSIPAYRSGIKENRSAV